MAQKKIHIVNRKARFEYNLLNKYTAGIKLWGTEIKSIRLGDAQINEAFCQLKNGELWIVNMYINEYAFGSYTNHRPTQVRKLLLQKKELKQISKKISEKGFTIVPLKVFISERGFAKIEIAVAQGKKIHDKRQTMKERDNKREMDRIKNSY